MPWPKGASPAPASTSAALTAHQAINEGIKELEYKDAKVRITNVDSQGSVANIVIQVIGEISNQGQPHKRFVQTFVLAEQTNGYFVLNDIFRFLAEEPEEDDEAQQEVANGTLEPVPTTAVPQAEANVTATSDEDLNKVDAKLEQVAQEPVETVPAQQAGEEIEQSQAKEAPAATTEDASHKESAAPAVEELIEAEKPVAPASTPAPTAPKAAPVAMPTGPPKPRTWASLAASAHKVATPAVPAPASQQATSQTKTATPSQPAAAAAAAAAAAPAQTKEAVRDQSPASQGEAAGWQTATGHKKEQSRVQNQGPAADPDQKRAYIKNVFPQVEEAALKTVLTKYGEVDYLDINRTKVCKSL